MSAPIPASAGVPTAKAAPGKAQIEPHPADLAARCKALIRSLKMTQADAAREIGTSGPQLSQWMSGKSPNGGGQPSQKVEGLAAAWMRRKEKPQGGAKKAQDTKAQKSRAAATKAKQLPQSKSRSPPAARRQRSKIAIGCTVTKVFEGHGMFEGKVVSVDDTEVPALYKVRFSDGDEEDYDADEMERLLSRVPKGFPEVRREPRCTRVCPITCQRFA
jgi:transcriptional regulator with XRE-family HTH domain